MGQIEGVFNGSFDLVENIKISPLSRAYTFSDSIYEVVPFYNSKAIAFDMHIERLLRSSNELSIALDIEQASNQITQLISNCPSENGYVYYQVTRGQDTIRAHMYKPLMDVETFGYVLPFSFETKTLKVMICEDIRWGRCDIKSTSLLGNVMQMNSAQKHDCDEVIMHKENILTEAGASNVFFVKNGTICTPALSNNILPGITRALLINEIKKINIPLIEGIFDLKDLSNASSAWLSSSTKGLAPISEIINLDNTLDIKDPIYLKCKDAFDYKFFS